MKKKITLLSLMVLSFLNIFSQPLANTTWAVYDPLNNFNGYFHFGTDTLSSSGTNFNFSPVSTYQVSGNTFTITDLSSGGGCPPADIGNYTYSIQNDTLDFIEVFDPCFGRATVIATFHWVQFATGIDDATTTPSIVLFPNPAHDFVTIKSKPDQLNSTYSVFDWSGRLVLTGMLSKELTLIDMAKLTAGLYFVKTNVEGNLLKLVKK